MDRKTERSELEGHIDAFNEALPKLLEESYGKYAVGRSDDKFVCMDTYEDAMKMGYEKYGLKSFLVRQVLEEQKNHFSGYLAA